MLGVKACESVVLASDTTWYLHCTYFNVNKSDRENTYAIELVESQ
jgi:hypothetical protein